MVEDAYYSKKEDKELVADYLSGQEDVLPILINRHLKSVYRFVFGLILDKETAEDITQEVFIKVWKKMKSYKPDHSFKTWLLSIARNTAIDYLRHKKDVAFSEFENESGDNLFVDTLADDHPLPDEDFSKVAEAGVLTDSLKKLPVLYREVLVLRYTNGLSIEEISILLKRPVETVKSQHRRGLLHLKALMPRI